MLIIFGIVFVSSPFVVYLLNPVFHRRRIWNRVGFWIIRHFGLEGSWSATDQLEGYRCIIMFDPRMEAHMGYAIFTETKLTKVEAK